MRSVIERARERLRTGAGSAVTGWRGIPTAAGEPGRAPERRHGHGRGHGRGPAPQIAAPRGVRLAALLTLIGLAGATLWGLLALWPDGAELARSAERSNYIAEGASFERGELLRLQEGCAVPGQDGAGAPGAGSSEAPSGPDAGAGTASEPGAAGSPEAECLTAGVGLLTGPDSGRYVQLQLRGPLAAAGLRTGDHLELLAVPSLPPAVQDGQGSDAGPGGASGSGSEAGHAAGSSEPARSYSATGVFRGWALALGAALFAAVVVAVGRWRGLLALAALGVAAWVLLAFVLPALLTGGPGLLIGVVGSSAIMFATLYFVHGPSLRTTAALLGTLCGILLMAAISLAAVSMTRLSGIGDEAGSVLAGAAGQIDFRGLLSCAIIIAGLGVLNDVTITQASAVWELHAAAPALSRREVYARAMRIGRDHIASTVYTVFFAYAGAALSVLILLTLYQRPLLSLLTHEDIATEIVRTLCGSVGLVLAVPITTALATLFLPRAEEAAPRWTDPGPAATGAEPSDSERESRGRREPAMRTPDQAGSDGRASEPG
ncbi:YibE/F family protein [Leucobacter massiliensis]|uniref:YibE/F family protein n=1 Tax=Leucobacter massiliensis TaxID=1686285 RepID=A0A2S9QSS4_9MICO|nr:YibE/F family protein [Leucobacter massiliensis]PRI12619.1 hypothetical protein B4915_00715 [Leucobacter massiliensis]